jgi:hypothetical protein
MRLQGCGVGGYSWEGGTPSTQDVETGRCGPTYLCKKQPDRRLSMRYMVFVKMAEDVGQAPAALQDVMGREMGEMFASGAMVDAGGLGPVSQSIEVRLRGGELTTTDGPYAEAKEVVGGYAIIDVATEAEARAAVTRVIEIHQQHWPGWEGSAEMRRIQGPDDAGPPGRS